MLRLLLLDDYHLDDRLFLQGLARALAQPQPNGPAYLVLHGSGERAERLLEAEGLIPRRLDGVLSTKTPAEAALVERALREANRFVTSLLTDAGVPSVGLQAADRRLVQQEADGTLLVQNPAWLADLQLKGIVLVLSTLVRATASVSVREAALVAVADALASAWPKEEVALFTFPKAAFWQQALAQDAHVSLAETPEAHLLLTPKEIGKLVQSGHHVVLTSPHKLTDGSVEGGVLLHM